MTDAADGIEVFAIPLQAPADGLDALWQLLSDDERARADRFHFAIHRRRFIVRRAALRRLLALRVGAGPEALRFDHGPQGKPALAGFALAFNMSHAEDLALIALGEGGPIGIDLERVRPIAELEAIARHHFSPAERKALEALPLAQRTLGFYQAWTRKEAMLKATGHGLSRSLDHYTVSLGPGVAPRVLSVNGALEEPAGWQLAEIVPGAGLIGAIAWQGAPRAFCLRQASASTGRS